MATKVGKILKRNVVTVEEGRDLGTPSDVRIDPDQHRIRLIVLAAGTVPDSALVVHADSVRSFDADKIAIDDLEALKIAAKDDDALKLLNTGLDFKNREVMTSRGDRLGKIRAVFVDEKGFVTQYRLRRGIRGILLPAVRVTPADLGTSGGEVAVAGEPGS